MRIDEMPAGPELDAIVAEKVMGWRPEGESWRDEKGQGGCASPPRWSSNINPAWAVVEQVYHRILWSGLIPEGSAAGVFNLSAYGNGRFGARFRIRLDEPMSTAPSAALAICRAALSAIEQLERIG